MRPADPRPLLVTGATGFVGGALVRALRERGVAVVAGTRRPVADRPAVGGVEWRECDLLRPATLPAALAGVRGAYYLVHSMGTPGADFRELERQAATAFVTAAAVAGLERIVYLGGPAPRGQPSAHLGSRLDVGGILRAGRVPALELRAAMVVGPGSASWRIVRDLALRLPAMVLPAWLKSRTRPVALVDVIAALVAAADLPLAESAWYDLPGPEILSGKEILQRIAALRGRHIPALDVPLLTPRLSAMWLRLVTGADFALARELVMGLTSDLLPDDDRFWQLVGQRELTLFDEAARQALAAEPPATGVGERVARAEERLVAALGTLLAPARRRPAAGPAPGAPPVEPRPLR